MATIFVFGSNLAGQHNGGAARHARVMCGAEMGIGEGPTGEAYALPTLNGDFSQRTLAEIAVLFQSYALRNPDRYFQVTRVGCGIAGFTDDQIAPLFVNPPENCGFDPLWASFGLPTWKEAR